MFLVRYKHSNFFHDLEIITFPYFYKYDKYDMTTIAINRAFSQMNYKILRVTAALVKIMQYLTSGFSILKAYFVVKTDAACG